MMVDLRHGDNGIAAAAAAAARNNNNNNNNNNNDDDDDDESGLIGVDPLNASGIVRLQQLNRWCDTIIPTDHVVSSSSASTTTTTRHHSTTPFPYHAKINEKVCLWTGDITALEIDAVVNSTNESLTDRNALSERLFRAAGPKLTAECRQLDGCRTGEASLTKGYDLPARYVIHTVGPRYNMKYKTAAESALYNCYRNVLALAVEQDLSAVAFCTVNSVKRGYPTDLGAHLALRTVRRFLEKHTGCIERIVFVCEGMDRHVYEQVMPIYFPRNSDEANFLLSSVPIDIGNENGEPVISERTIRILDTPIKHNENAIISATEIDSSPEFLKMTSNPDATRKSITAKSPEERALLEHRSRYNDWLRRARSYNFSDFRASRMIYRSGNDCMGRPVVCFAGKCFPALRYDLDKAASYFIQLLDPIVNCDYVIVYFHTGVTDENQPEMAWMRQVYNILDSKYHKNLRALYVVHPTIWSKCLAWWFSTFTAFDIKKRIHNVDSIQSLYNVLNHESLDIPPYVIEYDRFLNGNHYPSGGTL